MVIDEVYPTDIIKAPEIVNILSDCITSTTGKVLPKESGNNSSAVISTSFGLLGVTAPNAQLANCYADKPWTEIEDDKLCDKLVSKLKVADIAKEYSRTYRAVERRLEWLGLKKKSWVFFSFARNKTRFLTKAPLAQPGSFMCKCSPCPLAVPKERMYGLACARNYCLLLENGSTSSVVS